LTFETKRTQLAIHWHLDQIFYPGDRFIVPEKFCGTHLLVADCLIYQPALSDFMKIDAELKKLISDNRLLFYLSPDQWRFVRCAAHYQGDL
jgi:hypothetical protein